MTPLNYRVFFSFDFILWYVSVRYKSINERASFVKSSAHTKVNYLFFNTIFTIFTGTIPYYVVLLKKKKEIFNPKQPLAGRGPRLFVMQKNLFFQAEIFKKTNQNDKLLHCSHIQKGQINKISFVN